MRGSGNMSKQLKLIELVHNQPVLYDTNHLDYMKKSLKDHIWDRIAKEMNFNTGFEAKNLWLKLRNCHRDALRRKISKSGSAVKNIKSWKYEKEMQFLIQYMANRQTSGNIICKTEETLEEDYDAVEESLNSTEDEIHKPVENGTDEPETFFFPVNYGTSKSATVDEMFTLEQHQQTSCCVREKMLTNHDEADELFHFFMSMYKSVKKMPEVSKIRIKRKIFNIVSEEEEVLCSSSLMQPNYSDNC